MYRLSTFCNSFSLLCHPSESWDPGFTECFKRVWIPAFPPEADPPQADAGMTEGESVISLLFTKLTFCVLTFKIIYDIIYLLVLNKPPEGASNGCKNSRGSV